MRCNTLSSGLAFYRFLKTASLQITMVGISLFLSLISFAQNSTVTGKVMDANGAGLPGVTVQLKNATEATSTDGNGNFSLSVPNLNGTLVLTSVNYVRQEVAISNRADVGAIVMQQAAGGLDEVVVIGYGTARKRDLTSSVVTVQSKDFIQGAVNNPIQMVDGKVAGLTVSSSAIADPNAGLGLQIRGAGSFRAGNGPLIVIDGMPGGDLRNLNQNDIESITVLKDAASAAIYGSRGAGGVILVTTKKGRSNQGKVALTYDGFIEHDAVANKPEFLSAEEFLSRKRDQDYGARTNWYDLLLRKNNIGQNHYLSASNGNENSNFRLALNYREKPGIDIATDRMEYGARGNFMQKAIDGLLEISGNVSYRYVDEAYTDYDAFKQAVRLNPTLPLMDKDNPLRYNTLQGYDTYNPVQSLLTRENGAQREYNVIDLNFKLNLTKWLNTELKLARQTQSRLARFYTNAGSAESIQSGYIGRARQDNEKWQDYTLEWLGNLNRNFGSHNLNTVVGYSYQQFNNYGNWVQNRRFPSDYFGYNNLGLGNYGAGQAFNLGDVMGSWQSREKNIAFLGRVMYNYENTYFLTFSGRYEGNSKFGPENKWGFFPSASVAWRLNSLPVFSNNETISDLKLRVSYGETGRSGFDRYTALARYSGFGQYLNDEGQWVRVFGPGNNYNPNLKWERQRSVNAGIDFGLFANKLTGSFDWFMRKGSDLINDYQVPVPPYLHDRMYVNVGTQSNRGLELALNWAAINTERFKYNTNLTASYTVSRMDKLSNQNFTADFRKLYSLPSPGNPGEAFMLREGFEIGNFWGYRYAGVDGDGKILVYKEGKSGGEKILATGQAGEQDKVVIGNGMPKYEMAWGNQFEFGNLDLSLFFRGRFKYDILNLYQMYFGLQAEPGVNLLTDAYTRNGHITSGKVITDYFLEKGDYLKLDNLTLGWKTNALERYKLNNLRVYGTVRNLFTITKFTGLDPSAVGVTGLEPGIGQLGLYPITRTFTFGVQLNF